MPTTTTDDGVELYYRTEGSGETVVFVGEAGLGAWQWGWQYRHVAGPMEALVWDMRGTGCSGTPDGPYTVDRLASDLEAVLSAAGVRKAHVVGAGLGGMVALRYARRFSRVETLTLFNVASSGDAIDERALRSLCEPRADEAGLRDSLSGAFSERFRSANSDLIDRVCEWRREEDADCTGLEAQVAALEGFEAGPLYELTLPTLVCHGLDDPVVGSDAGEQLASDLPRGEFEPVEGRHLCFIEHSRAVSDRMLAFFDEHR